MSGEQAFCPKCGNPVTPGSSFCNKCGAPLGVRSRPAQPTPMPRREKAEKHEKQEKGEKREKGEKQEKGGSSLSGPLIGGSILIWLGITFYYERLGYFSAMNWWAYFLAGIGVILMVAGLVMGVMGRRAYVGNLIGGAVLFLVGLGGIQGAWENLWPLILVVIGAAVIIGGIYGRRRSPTP